MGKPFYRNAGVRHQILLALAVLSLPLVVLATAPQWWTDRGVTNSNGSRWCLGGGCLGGGRVSVVLGGVRSTHYTFRLNIIMCNV